ncbi:MAG: PQQ-dependent sugar dehydrogenase [Novosphingobium sp.]
MRLRTVLLTLLLGEALLASWWISRAGDRRGPPPPPYATTNPFTASPLATFDEPWAIAFIPGTRLALISERSGHLKLWQEGGPVREVLGVPRVVHEDQGGLGDIVLAPDYAASGMVYLSWAEAGPRGAAGAAVGRAKLLLAGETPRLEDLQVVWRQEPKVTTRGHYSHRLAFSPDGRYLFVASGERQMMTPAQDLGVNLGKIVRLLPDGTPAPGNPFAARGGMAAQVWSLGHRNVLGLHFDPEGRLWDLEHGPRGGDELNLVESGKNYGWPVVSDGDNYDGTPIPRHKTRPDFAAPKVSWNPIIAPGDFIFCRCEKFPEWRGKVLIAALAAQAIVMVDVDGGKAREAARYNMRERIRTLAERDDGALFALEDGSGGRLLRLTPR